MRTRKTAAIALVLFATGCTSLVYTARYDIGLSLVERRQRGGETKRFTDVHGHTFEDEFVKVTWTPFDSQLGLILTNKTDSSARIIWDEVIYAGPDKRSDHVIHEGVDITDRLMSMPPTVVMSGATMLDLIEPTRHIQPATVYGVSHEPSHAPLIGFTSGSTESEVRSKMVHGTIKVLLPIDANGAVREYLFQFSVKGSVVLTGWSS
jgi:hypothetical protein